MEPSIITITNWKDLYQLYVKEFFPTESKSWFFRGDNPGGECPSNTGDKDKKAALTSELDKTFDFYEIKPKRRLFNEKYLFRDFCRKQYLYTSYQPESEVEKLSLMRHHDGPTRLMDWTYSFFVAVYFAVNRAKNYCVVWAIDENWLTKKKNKLHTKLKLEKPVDKDDTWYNDEILKFFWNEDIWKKDQGYQLIYPMTSFYMNKRLTVQRGTFLCQADIAIPWYKNLDEMIGSLDINPLYQIIIQWGNKTEERNKIINMLFEMNINQATLFPDLDGLAMSLRTKLASPQVFPRGPMKT